ncbi:MAG: glycoside hydrolase family 16 protein [Luteimonas sp.]|nr:glycoside hydrolase family 16 protein [Luteimonas sp.]
MQVGRSGCTGLLCMLLAGAAVAGGDPAADARFEDAPSWQDEFDYTGKPDPRKWGYDTGGHGWGNNELQTYTRSEDNAFVRDGALHIVARRQQRKGRDFTSARLVSKGKGDFRYGRFEVRARMPQGRGTWPAIWMLPTGNAYGGWPRSGEIDIMEHVGFDPDVVHVSVHTRAYNHVKGTQKSATRRVPGASTAFHVYRLDWTPDAIRGYIDGEPMYAFANEGAGPAVWPFDQPFHVLLNVAVGGDWGGQHGVDQAAFPATMEVDYVRVYRMREQ